MILDTYQAEAFVESLIAARRYGGQVRCVEWRVHIDRVPVSVTAGYNSHGHIVVKVCTMDKTVVRQEHYRSLAGFEKAYRSSAAV